jgi:hypothetical protein
MPHVVVRIVALLEPEQIPDDSRVDANSGDQTNSDPRQDACDAVLSCPVCCDGACNQRPSCITGEYQGVHAKRLLNVTVKQRIGSTSATATGALPTGQEQHRALREHGRGVRVMTSKKERGARVQPDNSKGRAPSNEALTGGWRDIREQQKTFRRLPAILAPWPIG